MDAPYADTDFVYVDPEKRLVVGRVEWSKNGNAKPKIMPEPEQPADGARRRHGRPWKRAYPWGSYKTMKKIYRLEGREPEQRGAMDLDRAIEKVSREAFWENEVLADPNAVQDIERP